MLTTDFFFQVSIGLSLIILGVLWIREDKKLDLDSHSRALGCEAIVLIILLGILILFGYAKIDDIINQFIDRLQ